MNYKNEIIQNSNGHDYFVLEQKLDTLLLYDVSGKNKQYVIANNYNEKSKSWANAHYLSADYCSLEDALSVLNDVVKNKYTNREVHFDEWKKNGKGGNFYSFEEIFNRAIDKAHLSPELNAKDEAIYEMASFIESKTDIPIMEQDEAEERIISWLKSEDIAVLFNERGSLVYLNREGVIEFDDRESKEGLPEIEKADSDSEYVMDIVFDIERK